MNCSSRALLGAVSLLVATTSVAEADPSSGADSPDQNQIQADLGMTVIGIGYERTVAPQLTLGIAAESLETWFGHWFNRPELGGFGVGLRATWFPYGCAPHGLYVAAFSRIIRTTDWGNDGGIGATAGITGGLFIGESFVFAKHWNLRVGLGVQYIALQVPTATSSLAFRTLWPGLDTVLGYTF